MTEQQQQKESGQTGQAEEDGKTKVTVLVALGANLVIAAAKAAGGAFAGSPALLSEAAHSVADSLNEVFLLASLKRSRREPDAEHPFGYGKERFFWSLLAAVGIFVMGGCFSFYQGIEAMRSGGSESRTGYIVGFAVLAVALLAEGASLAKALLQVRSQARREGRGLFRQMRVADDPALRTVLAEDSTACLGVLLATAGMALHAATGDVVYEAWASLMIGVLLVYVAYRLGRETRKQLVGESVDPVQRQEIRAFLDGQPEVDTVTTMLTMRLGPESVLVAARLDLMPGLDSEVVEEVSKRMRTHICAEWPVVDQIFLDITDASAEDRARAQRERRELEVAAAEAAEA